ncbi:HD domain-containing protein [Bradyrhizobium aeschynomenes]|uniref:HD domain-containing protein n=1 Tax=Bradyrhizobium aeschynomenes TaxID=2734909 RepID=UPI0015540BB7|nr:ATP-binding protein [Bradyrhizobium aeschynomenes]NPV24533.1 ATP-binding protein [Bradyrhizobium aeschynomenes]
MELFSPAEQRAIAATELAPFPIQLHEVRRTVKAILDLFGRNNFFAEYTVHDFSHVEKMLDDLEWIIPEATKTAMTPTDWLLIVLSIYFHDLGLIVTEDEFLNRDKASFQDFCSNVLFAKNDGKDYRIKVETLGSDQAERFFYQEFVRFNHAKRVRAWIEGTIDDGLGYAKTQREELNRLFSGVDSDFRRDLALVCESHNLDDLEDTTKYKTFKPYGQKPTEAANLLYAAIILRTTDLLQITKQRAPSVMFRMINPTDPISQIEWTKQNAVKAVIPKPRIDRNGEVNPELQPDTISVYAKYDNENGFFGLTSYIAYAGQQLRYAFDCANKAKSQTAIKLDFPWNSIDDSQVEAVGFIPNPFEFQIDQAKILDLLTGHTLYNDSSVAIRELVQNSIDAVRLQCSLRAIDPRTHGKISIVWNSSDLTLTILDNGTGMTQEIIERHLLNVGSSRYQDPKFKERYPTFSPISRFGIGVLSAFMVADNVQIVTFHEDEAKGRQISLRSVHGKYLIRLLDKVSSDWREVGPHGTKITLKMRASSKRADVVDTLRRWIMFPRCLVTATIDGEAPVRIGFDSPKAAIESFISAAQLNLKRELVQVHETKIGTATLAFATVYNPHFRDRQFLQNGESFYQRTKVLPPVGVCIEGIRVEFSTPGFPPRGGVLSIIDCQGNDAPKTNVARSALESENEQNSLTSASFEIYLKQVRDEIQRLQEQEGFSLSYAVEQFPFIAGPLYSNARSDAAITEAFRTFPMLMVEDDEGSHVASIADLHLLDGFWTVESAPMASLVQLLKDTTAKVTCKKVAEFAEFKGAPLPSGTLITNSYLSTKPKGLLEASSRSANCEHRSLIAE